MSHIATLITVQEAAKLYGLSRATISRKIKSGDISNTQIVVDQTDKRITRIYFAELLRVFGEPPKAKNEPPHYVTLSHNVTHLDPRDAHIATLKEQIEHERQQLRDERHRADQLEREKAELRQEVDGMRQKLIESAAKPRPWWRVFG